MEKLLRMDFADFRYPPSAKVIEVLRDSIERINIYPDEDYKELKDALSVRFNYAPECFVFGNGLDEVIDLVTRAFCKQNDSIIIPIPTFSGFELAAKRQGIIIIQVKCMPEEKFKIDPKELLSKKSANTRIIWICSPNNPTGDIISQEIIREILEKSGCIVVVDEALADFSGTTNIELIKEYDNLIIMRSFSKSYGVAGLRIGFAAANPELIQKIEEVKQIFNVNTLAVKAACAAISDQEYYDKIWHEFNIEKMKIISSLEQLGIAVCGKQANILLLDFKQREASEYVYDELLKEGIIVFPGWSEEFTGLDGRFLRVVVGTPQENERFISALKKIIGDKNE